MKPATAALWIAKLVAAAFLVNAGYLKLTGDPMEIELFSMIGMEPAGRQVIGGIELLAALLILIPQSAVYGALLGLGVMVGATIGHLTTIGLAGLQNAALVAACCLMILYLRRSDSSFLSRLLDR